MKLTIDKKIGRHHTELARKVVKNLQLQEHNLKVLSKNDILHFTKGRFVVRIPTNMIENEAWSDIRFLFQSILKSAPQVLNTGSENTWGPEGPDY